MYNYTNFQIYIPPTKMPLAINYSFMFTIVNFHAMATLLAPKNCLGKSTVIVSAENRACCKQV